MSGSSSCYTSHSPPSSDHSIFLLPAAGYHEFSAGGAAGAAAVCLGRALPFMSSQNSPRDHLNETNLEMLSPVCPVPVLAVGAPCSARAVRLGHTNPSCLIHSCTGTRSWLEKRGLSHHCQPQHPVLSPCFGQPQLKNQQSLPSAQLYLDGSGQALTSPQRLCTVVFFWHRAVCCGDEIKYLEQEHALPCRDGLLRAQGWAGV